MENRRTFLSAVGAGIAGFAGGAVLTKEISASSDDCIVVFELPENCECDSEGLARIKAKVNESLPGYKVLVIPFGAKLSVIPNGGVLQREKLGEYEYEVVAKNEEDLAARLKALQVK